LDGSSPDSASLKVGSRLRGGVHRRNRLGEFFLLGRGHPRPRRGLEHTFAKRIPEGRLDRMEPLQILLPSRSAPGQGGLNSRNRLGGFFPLCPGNPRAQYGLRNNFWERTPEGRLDPMARSLMLPSQRPPPPPWGSPSQIAAADFLPCAGETLDQRIVIGIFFVSGFQRGALMGWRFS
jgi:hypothetical protein